jgi:hypothetical protein
MATEEHEITEFPYDDFTCPWCAQGLYPQLIQKAYSGYEGNFVKCPHCNAIFVQLQVGSQFTIGDALKACTVYQISEIKNPQLITCHEIAKVRNGVLVTPDRRFDTYLSRDHIVSAMVGHWREGLL